jgi:hypothetical protein
LIQRQYQDELCGRSAQRHGPSGRLPGTCRPASVPHDSERLLNLRPILQVDPSHHIVDWTLSRNAETALARGQETSLIDICMPKQLTTATVGPVRPGLPSRERRASVLTLPSPCPYLQLKKAVKDQYRQIVLHIWDNLVECVQAWPFQIASRAAPLTVACSSRVSG